VGKKKIEVCEHCGKETCSGKMYRAFDDQNDKLLAVCESQTEFMIRSDIYDGAIGERMLDASGEFDNMTSAITTTAKYIRRVAKKNGYTTIPVERVFFVGCGNFAIAMPKAWLHPQYEKYRHYENLSIPFSQLCRGEVYNNGCRTLGEVGQ